MRVSSTASRLMGTSSLSRVSPILLQRQCACGQHTSGGVECDSCRSGQGQFSRKSAAGKAVGETPTDYGERKRRPQNGSASIQCNGAGGYEITYGSYAGATCGTKDCVTAHESSHMADWRAKWPTGCQGQPRGYIPKGDPPDNPLMSVSEYDAFLKDSECRAYTADLQCAQALPKAGACKNTVEDYIKLTEKQKGHWCTGLPTWAKVLIGIGAAAGAGLIGGLIYSAVK
jgi:hypothetical protein